LEETIETLVAHELRPVVVRHRATADHSYVRVVTKKEHHLLDDVVRDE
jgi:hypothetical protein